MVSAFVESFGERALPKGASDAAIRICANSSLGDVAQWVHYGGGRTALVADVESSWASPFARYSDAQRPTTEFEQYVAAPDRWRSVLTCVNELGIYRVDYLKDQNGEHVGFDLRTTTADEMHQNVARWGCDVRFPQRPFAPLTVEQRGYLYDYQTQFVIPCIEAHGAHATTPPSKDDFVSTWPNQEWWPSAARSETGIDYDAIDDACPGFVPGM